MSPDPNVDRFVRAILSVPEVEGRFTDLRLLSSGGNFSLVFDALDRQTSRRVVLKFFRPDRQDPYRRACFQREGRLAGELVGHPNIVQLVAPPGTHHVPVSLADGTIIPFPFDYLVVERGVADFNSYLLSPRRKPRALWRRLEITRDIVKGVGRLHRLGYCHRDLKPDNVFLFPGGEAKLGDLGTCRKLEEPALQSGYGGPIGHRRYAAPETFCGAADDVSLLTVADWFGVGAILFESVASINLYTAIGLQTVAEIVTSFARFQSLTEYARVVADIAGEYPIPVLEDYTPQELLARHSSQTLRAVDRLIRALCHFDYRRRLADPARMYGRIDEAIALARRDEMQRNRRLIAVSRATVNPSVTVSRV